VEALHPDTVLAWAHNGEYLRHVHGRPWAWSSRSGRGTGGQMAPADRGVGPGIRVPPTRRPVIGRVRQKTEDIAPGGRALRPQTDPSWMMLPFNTQLEKSAPLLLGIVPLLVLCTGFT
jgi:hypothetical protein